jgi:hypothetical protein
MSVARQAHLDKFCRLLNAIAASDGGPRRLAECTGRDGWPRSGVYFFSEDGETREDGTSKGRARRHSRAPALRRRQAVEPAGFQDSATGPGLVFYVTRSCSLMRPPGTGRRLGVGSGPDRASAGGSGVMGTLLRLRSRIVLAAADAGWA